MTTSRIIIMLLTLTALMQLSIMHRQGGFSRPPASRPSVWDAPEGSVVDLVGMPVEGSAGAEIVLIEFSDYECPFCQRHATGVAKQLASDYVETGRIRYVFANNPLAMHANAPFMATAAICAGEQGHYWDMHDRLFEEPGAPKTRPVVLVLVGEMGMDTTVFEACLDESSTAKERIDRDIEKARELGLTGTPGFALGRIGSEGVVRIETLIRGAQPFATFESAIDALR